jgi:hypothetical protein
MAEFAVSPGAAMADNPAETCRNAKHLNNTQCGKNYFQQQRYGLLQ